MNNLKSLSVFARLFSRSCVREKMIDKSSGKALGGSKLKVAETPVVPVEEDTHRLANYVCGTNLFIEGGEDIKLKPDSEYPEWLWKITPPLPLEKLDPNTKTYWNKVRRMREKEEKFIKSLQKSKTLQK